VAYHNLDGVITIDEAAAQADIQKEAAAADILRQASATLGNVIAECSGWSGETVSAMSEKAAELQNQISALVSALEECQSYTRNVVEHYRELDLKWQAIMSQG